MDTRFLFICFLIFCNIYSYFFVLETGRYNGDFRGGISTLTQEELLYILILNIIIYFLAYVLYKLLYKNVKFKKIKLNSKIYWTMFILLIFQIILARTFELGFAGKINSSLINILVTRIPMKEGITLVYIIDRQNKRKHILFWPLVLIFIGFKLYSGWSGVLFSFAILEVYMFFPKFKFKFLKKIFLFILFIPIIQNLKFKFRGVSGNNNLNEHINFFIGRFSNYSNIAYLYQIREKFVEKFSILIGKFHYLLEYSYSFIPARLQGRSGNATVENLLFLRLNIPKNGDFSSVEAAFMPGFLGKSILLYNYSIIDLILFIGFHILLLKLLIFLSKEFGKNSKYLVFNYWIISLITTQFLKTDSIFLYALVFWKLFFWILTRRR